MEAWMREIGLVMSIEELGVTEDMFDCIVQGTPKLEGGYHCLDHDEAVAILKESL